jgi:hypothetical protein
MIVRRHRREVESTGILAQSWMDTSYTLSFGFYVAVVVK